MAYIQIPKDLSKIKTTVMFNLTKRQIIGLTIAGIISIPAYLFIRQYLGNDIGIISLMLLSFPILFITFYEKDGLRAEEYLKYIYLYKYYNPKVRLKKGGRRNRQ